MKKILCSLLVVVMCLTMAPLQGFFEIEFPDINFSKFNLPEFDNNSLFSDTAEAYTVREQLGNDVYFYYIVETQKAFITGTGAMWDFPDGFSIESLIPVKKIYIEKGITSFGANAFNGLNSSINIYFSGSQSQWSEITVGAGNENLSNLTIHFDVQIDPDDYRFYAKGTCCNNLEWTLDHFGTLTFSGTGPIYVYSKYYRDDLGGEHCDIKSSWHDFKNSIESVVISEGITSICGNAFRDLNNLQQITLPDSIISIGANAFYNTLYYSNYENWDNGVLYLGNYLIKAKNDLPENYSVKPGTVCIAAEAFKDCLNLNEITIPDSVISIGSDAFYGTAYYNNETNWEDGVLYIGNYLIKANENLPENYNIKPGTVVISGSAFYECSYLQKITIPDSVITIGDTAFYDCHRITEIFIPKSVTYIGLEIFVRCNDLTYILVDEENEYYSNDEYGVLFNKDKTHLICYTENISITEYFIPNSVTSIDAGAFDFCRILTNIVIPDGVKSIGDDAFFGCSSLTSIEMPASVTSIGDSAFYGCSSLTSIAIPNGVTNIGAYAFSECKKLTNVSIPDSITTIGVGLFMGCKSLTDITIPESVTTIGSDAFSYCSGLTSIKIPASVSSIGNFAFRGCAALTSIIVNEDNKYFSNDEYGILFSKEKDLLITYPANKPNTEYVIPDTVTNIAEYAFSDCCSLKEIIIPDSITDIGNYAFDFCLSLQKITIPDSVTNIGNHAFDFCRNLQEITISASITSIGYDAFLNCFSLTDVYYSGDKVQWKNISIDYGNDYLKNANIHYHYNTPHTYTAVVTAPTCTSMGYTTYSCLCDASYVADYVNKLSHKDSDGNNLCDYGCGYSFTTGNVNGNITEKLDNVLGLDYTFTYNDNYFSGSSYVYNHDLAIMSNCLAISAMVDELYYDIFKEFFADNSKISDTFILENNQPKYISEILTAIRSYSSKYKKKDEDEMTAQEKAEKRNAWQNIIYAVQSHGCAANDILMSSLTAGEFFNKIGFANPVHYNYMSIPQMNSIACVIANKKIGNATVIAIGIRGSGYGAEWGGNFNVGTAEEHEGFRIAKEKVLNYLSDYIKNNNITGDVKFWISGYSRAAATSNLVAATLDEGASSYSYISSLNYTPEDVYAYTFETPIPTKDKNTKNALYTNIFNIINRIDYVPKVAPETWGYSRYGVDCFLPSPETYGSKEYDTLLKKMKTQHKNITGKKYTENFTFYDAKFSVKTTGLFNRVFDISFVAPNGNVSQSRYLDEFITIIANNVIKSTSNYVNNYQSSVQKLMIALLGGGFENVEVPENTINEIKAALFEGIKSKIFNNKNDAWRSTLATILSSIDKFNLSYIDSYNLLGMVDEAIITGIAGYNYVYTLIENASDIKPAHFPEMNFAWVTALDGETIIEKINGKSYRVIKYNCPIDIKLYDEDDILLATICGDNVDIAEDCYLSIYIDSNGQKCFCLPEDVKYRFEITGTDNGEMNCSFNTYDFTTGQTIETINYYDISVSEGSQFFVEVDSKESDFDAPAKSLAEQVIIRNESDEEIEIDEILDTENATITVTVGSDSLLSPAIGGGMYNKGEFAKVEAYADTSEAFVGWYIDGQLVSTDASYRFMPENDCKIVAKWTSYCSVNGHIDSEWIIDIDATCAEEGLKHIECTVCGETLKTEAIAKLSHNYNAVVTVPSCTAQGFTTYTCECGDSYVADYVDTVEHNDNDGDEFCDYCDEFLGSDEEEIKCSHICHKSGFMGFIWKVINFFQKLFGISPMCECGAAHY